ncbi:MAG: hypothetical protein ACRCWD_08185 [Culicoidibacterales bacterium]
MPLTSDIALLTLRVYDDGCKTDMNVESEEDIQKMVFSLVSMFDQAPHIRALFELALESAEEVDALSHYDETNMFS